MGGKRWIGEAQGVPVLINLPALQTVLEQHMEAVMEAVRERDTRLILHPVFH
jgi:hypothetical protein